MQTRDQIRSSKSRRVVISRIPDTRAAGAFAERQGIGPPYGVIVDVEANELGNTHWSNGARARSRQALRDSDIELRMIDRIRFISCGDFDARRL